MHEFERQQLLDIIKKKGITDKKVLDAINKVERHLFVPQIVKQHAYKDTALPIGQGQTISQPYTVAFMTQELNCKKDDKILEIGTGSGYQAAVLLEMGCKVYSIERNYDIYNKTLKLFDELDLRAALRCSDGTIGWEEYAPYDGIIVTAGSPSAPERLIKQLKVGGKMVIPIGDKSNQVLNVILKKSEGETEIKKYPNFAFVPLIGIEGWKEK